MYPLGQGRPVGLASPSCRFCPCRAIRLRRDELVYWEPEWNQRCKRCAMIDEIQVENLALIREAALEPARGLTVLTGETGAGKTRCSRR